MTISIGGIEVLHCIPANQSGPDSNYEGLLPSTSILERGFRKSADRAAFPVDTIFDRDIVVPMHDRGKLRADNFDLTGMRKSRALIAWSPYNKIGTVQLAAILVSLHGLTHGQDSSRWTRLLVVRGLPSREHQGSKRLKAWIQLNGLQMDMSFAVCSIGKLAPD